MQTFDHPWGGSRNLLDSCGTKLTSNKVVHLDFEKVKPVRPVCVLGGDVTIDKVYALSQRALIGRFEYVRPS